MNCTGYYNYEQAHHPELPGQEKFEGPVIHPQFWPEDLDYSDKKVVVVGSGATAVTIVPSMADQAAHVTMLQRTPSFVVSRPEQDPLVVRSRHAGWHG
jgi:cation diffusion facilitator CzcD-associated flavoprotein CzcO